MSNPFASSGSGDGRSGGGANPFDTNAAPGANPFAPSEPTLDYLSAPAGAESRAVFRSSAGRPVAVKIAAVSLLVAGALSLAQAGIGVWAVFDLRDSFGRLMDLDTTRTAAFLATSYADDAETVMAVIVIGFGAVMTIAYMVVARSVWKGRNWPRNVSPFLAVMSLPALALGAVAILVVLAGVVACVALWMPGARNYAALS